MNSSQSIEPREGELHDLRALAPLMPSRTPGRLRVPRYDGDADALYWSDELPRIDARLESVLRPVLRYRTSLMLGEPDERWAAYWEAARSIFPHWIGFDADRRRPTWFRRVYFRRAQARLAKIIDRL